MRVRPFARARPGGEITSSGSTPSALGEPARRRARRSLCSHPSSSVAERAPAHGARVRVQQAERAQVEHHLGHAAGEEDPHGRVVARPVGQHVDEPGDGPVDPAPVVDGRPRQARRVGDRRDVQQQVRRAAEGGVDDHRVLDRLGRSGSRPSVRPSRHCACTARAVRRAMSSQIGWPEGASAACGTVSPSASATTCDVAAVPRNWQPPPGEAQARQPSSAASSSVTSPCAKRAPSVCTVPASSPERGGSVTPPGTITPGGPGTRPAPSSSPAGPCRRWRRRSRPCAAAASG